MKADINELLLECNKAVKHIDTLTKWAQNRIEEYMDMFQYDESVKMAIRGDFYGLKACYPEFIYQYFTNPELINKIKDENCKLPPERQAFYLMRDVAMGWLTEDITIMQLNSQNGLKIERNGSEGRNLLVTPESISNAPDFKCEYKGKVFYIEFITDYVQEWKLTGTVWFRWNKIKNLNRPDVFILGRSLMDDTFILMPSTKEVKAGRHHNKDGYFTTILPKHIHPFTVHKALEGMEWIINKL